MNFAEIKAAVEKTVATEVRANNPSYLEIVVMKSNLEDLKARLNSYFGAPVWPPENELAPEVAGVIKPLGGIGPGQILYFSRQDSGAVYVMMWPWGDGQHVTVKAGQK